jgi:hypothetical protein
LTDDQILQNSKPPHRRAGHFDEPDNMMLKRSQSQTPKLRARLIDMGATILAGSPSDYAKLIAEETEKWRKVIRAAGIRPE